VSPTKNRDKKPDNTYIHIQNEQTSMFNSLVDTSRDFTSH